jgi:hypothetical protein
MNVVELERKYLPYVRRVGSLVLLPADEAIRLLQDCASTNVRFLGIEAFRVFDDGAVQPALSFSNISYGKVGEQDGKTDFTPDFGLREGWFGDPTALQRSQDLIAKGTAEGYSWYEVHLENPATEEPLFS